MGNTVDMAQTVYVTAILGDAPPYCQRDISLTLNDAQSVALGRLLGYLRDTGATLADGAQITNSRLAMLWLVEQLNQEERECVTFVGRSKRGKKCVNCGKGRAEHDQWEA